MKQIRRCYSDAVGSFLRRWRWNKSSGPMPMCAEHELLEVTDRASGGFCKRGFEITSQEDMGAFSFPPVSYRVIGPISFAWCWDHQPPPLQQLDWSARLCMHIQGRRNGSLPQPWSKVHVECSLKCCTAHLHAITEEAHHSGRGRSQPKHSSRVCRKWPGMGGYLLRGWKAVSEFKGAVKVHLSPR